MTPQYLKFTVTYISWSCDFAWSIKHWPVFFILGMIVQWPHFTREPLWHACNCPASFHNILNNFRQIFNSPGLNGQFHMECDIVILFPVTVILHNILNTIWWIYFVFNLNADDRINTWSLLWHDFHGLSILFNIADIIREIWSFLR